MGRDNTVPRLTVLTATYDRAATLPRLYESLVAQTAMEFEWLVIDDGSTDDTKRLIADLTSAAPFQITYDWQENGGKHVALNRGIAKVRTELCAVMDSDDWYLPDGLERLMRRWDELPAPGDKEFANVEGRSQFADGTALSPDLPTDVVDYDYYDATVVHRMGGDTCGIWRADVLREYPFPEDLGPFVSEDLVFNRIAQRFCTRYCNDIVRFVEYRPGGLSDRQTSTQRLVESAPARLVHDRELIGFKRPMPGGLWARTHSNESRNALHLGHGLARQWRETPNRAGWLVTLPAGVALYVRDRARLRRGERR